MASFTHKRKGNPHNKRKVIRAADRQFSAKRKCERNLKYKQGQDMISTCYDFDYWVDKKVGRSHTWLKV